MPHARSLRLLIIAVPLLVFVGFLAILRQSRRTAMQRIAAADPLPGIRALRGKPILILSTDLDSGTPLAEHGAKIAETLKPECRLVQYPAIGIGYLAMYDQKRILEFLKAHISGRPTVFLLHGRNMDASAWTKPVHASFPADVARVALANALRKRYDCQAVELGPNSWGNDSSVAALNRAIGEHRNVVLIGDMMGALAMWRWAEKNPTSVAALIGITPVCSLTAVAEGNGGSEVRRAYGSL